MFNLGTLWPNWHIKLTTTFPVSTVVISLFSTELFSLSNLFCPLRRRIFKPHHLQPAKYLHNIEIAYEMHPEWSGQSGRLEAMNWFNIRESSLRVLLLKTNWSAAEIKTEPSIWYSPLREPPALDSKPVHHNISTLGVSNSSFLELHLFQMVVCFSYT